ncbi:hypothetical protein Aduo_015555 [Ancylostoma duodenale]
MDLHNGPPGRNSNRGSRENNGHLVWMAHPDMMPDTALAQQELVMLLPDMAVRDPFAICGLVSCRPPRHKATADPFSIGGSESWRPPHHWATAGPFSTGGTVSWLPPTIGSWRAFSPSVEPYSGVPHIIVPRRALSASVDPYPDVSLTVEPRRVLPPLVDPYLVDIHGVLHVIEAERTDPIMYAGVLHTIGPQWPLQSGQRLTLNLVFSLTIRPNRTRSSSAKPYLSIFTTFEPRHTCFLSEHPCPL